MMRTVTANLRLSPRGSRQAECDSNKRSARAGSARWRANDFDDEDNTARLANNENPDFYRYNIPSQHSSSCKYEQNHFVLRTHSLNTNSCLVYFQLKPRGRDERNWCWKSEFQKSHIFQCHYLFADGTHHGMCCILG
jgi:hypothetical protein